MGGWSSDSPKSYNWSKKPSVTKKSAKAYAQDDKRVYEGDAAKGGAPVGREIQTDEAFVNVIMVDQTGSMREEPERFFKKAPALYEESNAILQGYTLDELEKMAQPIPNKLSVSFFAIGDAYTDAYPLQVTDFEKKDGLVKAINSIRPEGNGGGQGMESYELAAYYANNHCKTPNCQKPLCVIFGDETFYDKLMKQHVKKYIGDDIPNNLSSFSILEQLKQRFDTYVLQPELSYSKEEYKRIHEKWRKVMGVEKVMVLDSVERAVDCIIGLNGVSSNNWNNAKEMLERRQRTDQVNEVIETLHPTLGAKNLK